MNILYERIHFLCSERGITVATMCKEVSISRGNISDLKAERIKSLSAESLNKIAKYFDITLDFLLTGNEFGVRMVDDWPDEVQRMWQDAADDSERRKILKNYGVTPFNMGSLPSLFGERHTQEQVSTPADEFRRKLNEEIDKLGKEEQRALLEMVYILRRSSQRLTQGELDG